MGIIQQKWQEEQSRIEDGIFFGSDECVALVGAPEAGYTIGERQSIAAIIAADPEGWSALIETVTARALTKFLKEAQAIGVVERRIEGGYPPIATYQVSRSAAPLVAILRQLATP